MRSRLLRAHFLRRLVHNDLISPHADRHQVLAISCAALVASGMFLTVLLSLKYAFHPLQTPGWTAVVSLDDLFLYCALSMLVLAAVALAAWDALTLDARDVAVLGWLPVPRWTLLGSQLTAVLLFALVYLAAQNAVPSVMAPVLRVGKLAIPLISLLYLIGVQAAVAGLAGAFGFLVVVGTREVLRAALGTRAFERVSALVQTTLVVGVATALLTVPMLYSGVERRWLASASAPLVPPLWFVGLHDVLAGGVVEALPAREPPRDAPARHAMVAFEAEKMASYRAVRPRLREQAALGVGAMALAVLAAAASWAWNNRRLPAGAPVRLARRSRRGSTVTRLVGATLARHPCALAGFTFALQAVRRSRPHRVALATAAGVAIALGGMVLGGSDRGSATLGSPRDQPRAVFAMQPLIVTVLIAGFVHASRIPAGLKGNATFALAWSEQRRPWADGVKKAGVVLVVVAPIAALFPLHAAMLGFGVAAAHAIIVALAAGCLLELAFLQDGTVPFVSRYEPLEHALAIAPIYIALTGAAVFLFATVERFALAGPPRARVLILTLAAIWLALSVLSRRRPSRPGAIDADDIPGAVQPLNLLE